MPRYECPLSEPRRKRRKGKKETLQQPFPVPIASMTEIKASNAIWRWYSGQLIKEANGSCYVRVGDREEGKNLYTLGFFGTREDEEGNINQRTPVLKDIDPLPALKGQKLPKEDFSAEKSDEEDDEGVGSAGGRKRRPDMNALLPVRLEPCEAFFLAYGLTCLIVKDDQDRELAVDDLWREFCEQNSEFPYLYRAYHHFRTKGWVVKEGYKFGVDFLLYKDGPPFYHASYSVQVQISGQSPGCKRRKMSWNDLAGLNRITEAAAKELMFAKVTFGPLSKSPNEEEKEQSEKVATAEKEGSSLASSVTDAFSSAEVLKLMDIKEILVRRWVPTQEREED